MSKYSTITGSLQSNSHMFYLSRESKIFILKILASTSEPVFILCSLSPSLQQQTREKCKEFLLNPPVIGQEIVFSNVKKVTNIEKESGRKSQNIYQLTKHSLIQVSDVVISPRPNNLHHETASTNLGKREIEKLYCNKLTLSI